MTVTGTRVAQIVTNRIDETFLTGVNQAASTTLSLGQLLTIAGAVLSDDELQNGLRVAAEDQRELQANINNLQRYLDNQYERGGPDFVATALTSAVDALETAQSRVFDPQNDTIAVDSGA